MSAADKIELIFSFLSAIGAMLAALFWFKASVITLPSHTMDNWDGEGPFSTALKQQSRVNALAATFAAGAALSQTVSLSVHVIAAYAAILIK